MGCTLSYDSLPTSLTCGSTWLPLRQVNRQHSLFGGARGTFADHDQAPPVYT